MRASVQPLGVTAIKSARTIVCMDENKAMPIAAWNTTATTRYPQLQQSLDLDVAIIGGGITALTAALQLARAGKRVAVLELLTVGAGSTGDSTGHLTACLDLSYAELSARVGEDWARLVAQSSMAAIDCIERTIAELNIDCDFARVPGFRFSQSAAGAADLKREAVLTRALGLETSYSSVAPLAATGVLRFEHQAQFDAPRYCQALAAALPQYGAAVYGDTLVESVVDGDPCVIHAAGQVVTAHAVIMATHLPLNRVLTLQDQLKPYTTYTLAFQLGDLNFPEGLFWDTEEPYHYIRRVTDKDRQLLLVGGADHPTGQSRDTDKSFEMLETYARKTLPVLSVEYRGSGQIFVAADGLPYIGELPGMTNVQVATGFAGTGLTFGTVAGMLMADIVLDRPNAWRMLYRPSRAKHIASLHVDSVHLESVSVPIGEGRLVEVDEEIVAMYRDQDGLLHMFSAACTHMGCTVQWNNAAQSWDCPCHGGRYRPTGEVLCAPPTQALKSWSPQATIQLERRLA